MEIKDKKGSDNVIADHLSRLEKPTGEEEEIEIEEKFPDEQLFQMTVQVPWYVDIVNYLACGIMPPEFSYHVVTPEPGPTRLADPNRNPGDARPKPLTKSVYQIHFILKSFAEAVSI